VQDSRFFLASTGLLEGPTLADGVWKMPKLVNLVVPHSCVDGTKSCVGNRSVDELTEGIWDFCEPWLVVAALGRDAA